ncbi:hypothetical protein B0A48_10015 [Cryoendolithus antarcticus]|uniref:Protein CASP n=1 Tax=Cryoendolithus antarcticus TaxID=1507870 RepID=A0A1V8T3L9_9PEZI|nr:hypothetical protein B0A48_10015 [Cryoendolithus antarcticus]
MATINGDDTTTDGALAGANGDHPPPETTTTPKPSTFQTAVSAWRTLSLSTLLPTLDTAAQSLQTHQRTALLQRKDLAQRTKDFRKLPDEAKLTEFKDLLKHYQSYVDLLTEQGKDAAGAFMRVYTPLSDVPDPWPLLEAAVDAVGVVEEVLPRAEGEREDLRRRCEELEARADESEREAEREREWKEIAEGEVEKKVKEVEEGWQAVLREKEDNWTAKESSLQEKVESQERLLKELKASYDVSQRLEESGEEREEGGSSTVSAAELELAHSELERAHARLAEVEVRNEQMRVELAQFASHSSSRSTAVEDEPAFLRLRSENSSLIRRLDGARHEKDAEKTTLKQRQRTLEKEVQALKADRETLQSRSAKYADYDELKRELDILRSIEFATGDEDDGDNTEAASNSTLESLLIARNKKLSSDLTDLRNAHNSMQQSLEQLQDSLASAETELDLSRKLNATLESDLQKTQQEASNAFETVSVAGTYTSRYAPSNTRTLYGSTSRRANNPSPTSSIIGGFDPSGHSSPRPGTGTLDSLRAAEAPQNTGILPMVTAQRDRFKTKLSEIETELAKQYALVSSLREEISALQRDNLALYEKTRYVSAYNRSPNPASSSATGSEDKYARSYESSLTLPSSSPFTAWRGRESARVMKRMSAPERALVRLMRFVVQTRVSRNLVGGYLLVLHGLVFWMLVVGTGAATHGSVTGSAVTGAGGTTWEREGFEGSE